MQSVQNTDNTLLVTLDLILHFYEMLATYGPKMNEQEEEEVREYSTRTTGRAAVLVMALARHSGIDVDKVVEQMCDSTNEEKAKVFKSILGDFKSIPGEISDIGEATDQCLWYVVALIVIVSAWVDDDCQERLEEAVLLSCTVLTLAVVAADEDRALQSVEKAIKHFAEGLMDNEVTAEQIRWLKKLFDSDNLADRFKDKASYINEVPSWYINVSDN